jgi:hypothetical protein
MMAAYSAPDIYHRIRGGAGSGGLTSSADFSDQQKQLQNEINQKINDLNTKMDAAWQGDASTQAVSGARPLASATESAAWSLDQAQGAISSQVDAFHTAYNSVVPLATTPPQNNAVNQFVSAFGVQTPLDNQINQYNSGANNNIQVYNNYSSASAANAAAMPTDYGTLPNPNPNISVVSPMISGGGGSGYGGSSGAYATGGGYPSGYAGSSAATGYSSAGSSPSSTGGGWTEPGSTGLVGGSSYIEPPGVNTQSTQPSGAAAGTLGSEAGAGFGGLSGGLPVGSDPTGKTNAYGGPNAGELRLAGSAAGGFGESGGLGAGGAGAAGTGAESASGQGGRSGLGLNASSADEAISRAGFAGAAGEPGMGGGMGAGQGRKGEDDQEHKTAEYLQEADPDAIFGSDEMTVPPVIGG